MAIQIDHSKLLADFRQAQEDLALAREIHEADVRSRVKPYLDKGILNDDSVASIVDKLSAADQEAFDSKWGTVKQYVVDAPDDAANAIEREDVADFDAAEVAGQLGEQQEAIPTFGAGYQIN